MSLLSGGSQICLGANDWGVILFTGVIGDYDKKSYAVPYTYKDNNNTAKLIELYLYGSVMSYVWA